MILGPFCTITAINSVPSPWPITLRKHTLR